MLVYFILFFIFILDYLKLSVKIKLILLIINYFLPDPIPFIDEIVMIAISLRDMIDLIKEKRR